jgi:hypothetical protein
MEFLETIESIRAEEASVQRLFNSQKDGVGVRTGTRGKNPAYMGKLAEAARLVEDVYKGKRPAHLLREAMTTSDFPNLFGDILDRQLLASYREAPYSWNQIVKRATVRDFRTVKRFTLDGGEGDLDVVAEQANYPAASLSDGVYSYAVKKYGRRMPFSWEALINDDLDALKDIPERLGKAARRTEEKFVTELFVDASGPHASYYTAGNANIVTSNPVLSIAALQTAMKVIGAMVDADSEPIAIEMFTLWVPPALEVTAQNILSALQLELAEGGGTSNQKLITSNWMKSRVRLAVGYYIPIVASTANGSTSWFLFANPAGGSRPAGEAGFLRGHEEPEVFIKSPNAQRVGGGLVDALAGDFETDSVEYKVRHVIGGSRMDPKMSVASNGSGS